jgi:hypothetical protein
VVFESYKIPISVKRIVFDRDPEKEFLKTMTKLEERIKGEIG